MSKYIFSLVLISILIPLSSYNWHNSWLVHNTVDLNSISDIDSAILLEFEKNGFTIDTSFLSIDEMHFYRFRTLGISGPTNISICKCVDSVKKYILTYNNFDRNKITGPFPCRGNLQCDSLVRVEVWYFHSNEKSELCFYSNEEIFSKSKKLPFPIKSYVYETSIICVTPYDFQTENAIYLNFINNLDQVFNSY